MGRSYLTGPDRDTALDRAGRAIAAAWDYYRTQAARSWVPKYLASRGLDPAAAGYAPGGWIHLVDHLRGLGYTDAEIRAAGLARTSSRGTLIDAFRHRAVLPYHDSNGRVVDFTGRKYPRDSNPEPPNT